MKNEVSIGGVTTRPGTKNSYSLKIGEHSDGSPIELPIVVINGSETGCKLYLGGGIHGNEVHGIEVVRRIAVETDPKTIAGTLICVPVCNRPAFITHSRKFTLDLPTHKTPQNMDEVFPGKKDGFITERIAYTLFNEVVCKADRAIDMHTSEAGGIFHPFGIVEYLGDKKMEREIEKMAEASGIELIRLYGEDDNFPVAAASKGIPLLIIESGGGSQLIEDYVSIGVRCVRNVMKYCGMLKGEPERPKDHTKIGDLILVRANRGGLLSHMYVKLGDRVKKGQLLAEIASINRIGEVEEIKAPVSGIILRIMTLPYVTTGDPVFMIAVPLK